jgi:hypothetical protein
MLLFGIFYSLKTDLLKLSFEGSNAASNAAPAARTAAVAKIPASRGAVLCELKLQQLLLRIWKNL